MFFFFSDTYYLFHETKNTDRPINANPFGGPSVPIMPTSNPMINPMMPTTGVMNPMNNGTMMGATPFTSGGQFQPMTGPAFVNPTPTPSSFPPPTSSFTSTPANPFDMSFDPLE